MPPSSKAGLYGKTVGTNDVPLYYSHTFVFIINITVNDEKQKCFRWQNGLAVLMSGYPALSSWNNYDASRHP
jgi:hypothetical protein